MYPKVVKSVHYCPATGATQTRMYTDMTSLAAFPSSSVYPTQVRIELTLTVMNAESMYKFDFRIRMTMEIYWRQNTDFQCTRITKCSRFKKCQRNHRQVRLFNFVFLMSS